MEGELLSTATDAGVFSSPLLSSGNLGFFMNECMAVCPRCLLFECELAWCYEGDGDFIAFGAVVCCFACLCLLYFSSSSSSCVGMLACCGRSSGAVCVDSCPPSPPLNVSFSLADIQFEWLAAAG